ncbi:MAG TPA: SGNH/GDSL hydrolase family protein [Solirubrobacteraceae bacterium]|nr:SGNH/GDSL hydrolase family protein [Solirubrobacteraceae bacterium]
MRSALLHRHARTPRDRGRTRLRGGMMVALLVGVLGVVLPPAASAAGLSYVAMGDSYTAGPGLEPYSPTAPPECGQSTTNYPHRVAAILGLSLTDVSCGGAKTENFYVAQYPAQPPQFDALNESTEVVSFGMGGNDHNLFGTLVEGCTALDYGQPNVGAPCKKAYGAFVTKTFEEDIGPSEEAMREIHVLAPHAKVFAVGYPEITPKEGYCPTAIPWTSGDLKWFHSSVQSRGNAILRAEAKANGVIFVNTFPQSAGHNACEPVGTRWIEPLFGSLTGVAVHPNALGQENDALDVLRAMLNAGIR